MGVIAVRSAYAAVNYRRPGLSSRCSPCLELSAAARHVCTVSLHLPKPSEDSPLQPLLSSCQAREVISSLRPFLLLLLSVMVSRRTWTKGSLLMKYICLCIKSTVRIESSTQQVCNCIMSVGVFFLYIVFNFVLVSCNLTELVFL